MTLLLSSVASKHRCRRQYRKKYSFPEEVPWLGDPWSVGWQGPGESVLYERVGLPGADQMRGARDRKALGLSGGAQPVASKGGPGHFDVVAARIGRAHIATPGHTALLLSNGLLVDEILFLRRGHKN